jgi:hypothetical protein
VPCITAAGRTAAVAPLGGIGWTVGGIAVVAVVGIGHCLGLHSVVQHIVDLASAVEELHIVKIQNFKDSYLALIHTVEHTNTMASCLGSYTHLAIAFSY